MATPHDRPKLSFTATARQIVAEGGLKGYYRGLGPTLLRAFPVNASALWVYEGLMRALGAEKVSSTGVELSDHETNHLSRRGISISASGTYLQHPI